MALQSIIDFDYNANRLLILITTRGTADRLLVTHAERVQRI
jgi:hypothetical protein